MLSKGERDKLRERVDSHEGSTYEEVHRLLDDLDSAEKEIALKDTEIEQWKDKYWAVFAEHI